MFNVFNNILVYHGSIFTVEKIPFSLFLTHDVLYVMSASYSSIQQQKKFRSDVNVR